MAILDDLKEKFPDMSESDLMLSLNKQGLDNNGNEMPGIASPDSPANPGLNFDYMGKGSIDDKPILEEDVKDLPPLQRPDNVYNESDERTPANDNDVSDDKPDKDSENDSNNDDDNSDEENNDSSNQKENDAIDKIKKSVDDDDKNQKQGAPVTKPDLSALLDSYKALQSQKNPSQIPQTTQAFNDALQKRRNAENTDVLSRIGNQLGGAIGRVTPNVVKANNDLADSVASLGGQDLRDIQDMHAHEAQDPNSNYSMKAKDFLVRNMGVNPKALEGLSVDQLQNTFVGPYLKVFEAGETRKAMVAKQQQDAALKRELLATKDADSAERLQDKMNDPLRLIALQNKKDADDLKQQQKLADNYQKMRKDMQTFRGNQAVQQANIGLKNSDAAMAIINSAKDGDYDNLNDTQYNTLTAEIAKIAQGGAATEGGIHDQRAKTLESRAASFMQAVSGRPTPAQLGEFVKQNKEYLDNLNKINHKYVDSYKYNIAKGYKGKVRPEDYSEGLEDEGLTNYKPNNTNLNDNNNNTVSVINPKTGKAKLIPKDQLQAALDAGGKLVGQ